MDARTARNSARALASRLAEIPVLIADPDKHVANLVRDVMKSVGFFNIHVVKDGAEALRVIESEGIELVIVDWQLNGMNGLDMLKHLRGDEESPNRFLPVIMLTGRAERRDIETARDTGVTEYLAKPFTAKALFERVVQVIENPRSFILAKNYKGPDRRRRTMEAEPPKERRKSRKKST
jgi:two-component system, chemotaxis family, chemotaxis protein CheY